MLHHSDCRDRAWGMWGCGGGFGLGKMVDLPKYLTDRQSTSASLCSPPLLVPCITNVAAMIWTCSWWDTLHLHNMWSRRPSLPLTRTRHPTGKAQDISELKSTTKIRGCKIFFPAVIPQIFPDTEPHSTGHAFSSLHPVTSQYSNIYACPNFYQ